MPTTHKKYPATLNMSMGKTHVHANHHKHMHETTKVNKLNMTSFKGLRSI